MTAINTRISPTGHISRRIAGKRMKHRAVTARLLTEAFDDISDGDNDNRRAARILMQLQELGMYEHHVDAQMYDGDLAGAEKSADLYLLKESDRD
jgi:hypothetical protein